MKPREGHPAAGGGRPAIEALKQDVQEIRAGRAALCQPIGGMPRGAVDATIAEAARHGGVEGLEAVHGGGRDPGVAEGAKHRPPGEGVEALHHVEGGEP